MEKIKLLKGVAFIEQTGAGTPSSIEILVPIDAVACFVKQPGNNQYNAFLKSGYNLNLSYKVKSVSISLDTTKVEIL